MILLKAPLDSLTTLAPLSMYLHYHDFDDDFDDDEDMIMLMMMTMSGACRPHWLP